MVGAQGGLKGTWRLFNIEVKALDDPGKDSAAVSPALLKVHPHHRTSEETTTRKSAPDGRRARGALD